MDTDTSSASEGTRPAALFLIHDLRPGGAEQVYLSYLRHTRALRVVPVLVRPFGSFAHEIPVDQHIYHLEAGGDRRARDPDRPWAIDSPLPAVRTGLMSGAGSLLLKSRRLAVIARRESANVVSSFLHKSHVVALFTKLFWNRDLRVVVNMHVQPVRHLETHFPRSRRPLMRAYYRWLLPHADRITAVSRGVRDELVDDFDVPEELISVIPNPIEVQSLREKATAKLASDELPAGPGPLAVAVGRLESVKGFDLLLRAVHEVRLQMPVRLAIVGEGSERGSLQQSISSLGLADSVALLGYRKNPFPYMAAADVMVLSSRSEAWPNVIGEAMAVGAPILATRCAPGVEELLGGGRFGHLVDSDDVGALAAGLLDVLLGRSSVDRDPGPRAAWAREFEPAQMVERYELALLSACGLAPAANRP